MFIIVLLASGAYDMIASSPSWHTPGLHGYAVITITTTITVTITGASIIVGANMIMMMLMVLPSGDYNDAKTTAMDMKPMTIMMVVMINTQLSAVCKAKMAITTKV